MSFKKTDFPITPGLKKARELAEKAKSRKAWGEAKKWEQEEIKVLIETKEYKDFVKKQTRKKRSLCF